MGNTLDVQSSKIEVDPLVENENAIKEVLNNAQIAFNQISGLYKQVSSDLAAATKNKDEIINIKEGVDTALIEINVAKGLAMETKTQFDVDAKEIKGYVALAKAADERVSKYEESLGALNLSCQNQLDVIKGLLPSATSAGLSSAFNERRKEFLRPGELWNYVFLGALIGLIALGVTGLYQSWGDSKITFEYVLTLWAIRLPVAGSLIWLAIHAAREGALAKRLEEDYGYKAAIAASLEGFQEQATKITTTDEKQPISVLYGNTLKEIANPPGRIYEKHKLTSSMPKFLGGADKIIDRSGD